MKFTAAVLLTLLFSFIAGLFLPWWTIALVAFLVALSIHQKAWKAFLAGFTGLFLLWGALSWWIDLKNESILSTRVGEIFGVGPHPSLMIIITALIGALVAGFAALSGSYLRSRPKTS